MTAASQGEVLQGRARGVRLLLALLFTVLATAALITGAAVQEALGWGDRLGWLQLGSLLVFSLGFLAVVPGLTGRDAGLGRPTAIRRWWWPAVLVTVLVLAAGSAYFLVTSSVTPFVAPAEEIAFEATAPGLAEEVAFRGVLLGLLLPCFRTWRVLGGVPVSWALVLQAVPFALLHLAGSAGGLDVTLGLVTNLAAALGFGWVRLKAGSVWPAVLMHNVANVIMSLTFDRF